jgi:hypothetical protein
LLAVLPACRATLRHRIEPGCANKKPREEGGARFEENTMKAVSIQAVGP